jgi:hypothetical protein
MGSGWDPDVVCGRAGELNRVSLDSSQRTATPLMSLGELVQSTDGR